MKKMMGKSGRVKMEQDFDVKIVIKRYLNEIKEALNDHKPQDTRLARWIFWLACLAVTTFSLIPAEHLPVSASSFSWEDKVLHAIAYATLTFIGMKAFQNHTVRVLAGLCILGAVIEIIQEDTGWRQGEVLDLLANTTGIFAGYGLSQLRTVGKKE